MPNLYKALIAELHKRNVANIPIQAPFMIASVGCHVFNQVNEQKRLLTAGGLGINDRLHLIFVGPSGTGKSYPMKQFLLNQYSIIFGTSIMTDFMGGVSEAGLVGKLETPPASSEKKEPVEVPGFFKTHDKAIVGIDEFSGITSAMQQTHNAYLDTTLLRALDDGHVRKTLANGDLDYYTHMTMWAGVQPAKFDMSSGLARRVCFIVHLPNKKDMDTLARAIIGSYNVEIDNSDLSTLKGDLNIRYKEIAQIKTIDIDKKLLDYIYSITGPTGAVEIDMYRRIALGYTLMNLDKIGEHVDITMDEELKRILKVEYEQRRLVKFGTHIMQVAKLVKEANSILKTELVELCLGFSLSMDVVEEIIRKLVIMKWIKLTPDKYLVWTRDKKKL